MSCKYQECAKYQEGKIRFLEPELKAAREEIIFLKAGNTSSKIKDQDNSSDFWIKSKYLSPRPTGSLLMMRLIFS
jgi:hypothetical protein